MPVLIKLYLKGTLRAMENLGTKYGRFMLYLFGRKQYHTFSWSRKRLLCFSYLLSVRDCLCVQRKADVLHSLPVEKLELLGPGWCPSPGRICCWRNLGMDALGQTQACCLNAGASCELWFICMWEISRSAAWILNPFLLLS